MAAQTLEEIKKGMSDKVFSQIVDIFLRQSESKTESEPTGWIVSVINGSTYCGIGAGGVQFANGRAEITSKRMADWFKEHEGYNVIEQ